MALLFNPVRRDELFDSGTGKIKDTLIPDIAAVGDATDITFDPTGREYSPASTDVDLALVEAINRVKALEDGGTSVEGIVSWRNALNESIITTPTQISNLSLIITNTEGATPPGNYRVKAIIKCLMASGKNENLTVNFYKRNTITPTAWAVINEEITFNQAYLTVETSNYGIENRPNYLVLEEVLPSLINGDEIGVFVFSETNSAATIENSQLFYEKTDMTVTRSAANFDI